MSFSQHYQRLQSDMITVSRVRSERRSVSLSCEERAGKSPVWRQWLVEGGLRCVIIDNYETQTVRFVYDDQAITINHISVAGHFPQSSHLNPFKGTPQPTSGAFK